MLGQSREVAPKSRPAFDGNLETPSGVVTITLVGGQQVLREPVIGAQRARARLDKPSQRTGRGHYRIGMSRLRRAMTQDNKLTGMSVEQLAERFLDITMQQHHAEMDDDYAAYNRLYRQMEAVEKELKSRPGDQRRILFPLYNHQKAQVRFMAAVATLAIAPDAARAVLQLIGDRNAADARGIMRDLDAGRFVVS